YSLGVILYELLTGQRPYAIEKGTAVSVARAIVETMPTRPSSVLARKREVQNNARRDGHLVRGDIDNIVLKALRKEPSRRYASVAGFSDDIRRHLEGRPVSARSDTLGYRAAKFVRRNKAAVAASALVVVAIVAGLIIALREGQVARRQRDLAEREKAVAQNTSNFLQEMLGAAAPEKRGADIRVTDLMNEASQRAREQTATNPEGMADVLTTLGKTYISLGLYAPAEADLRAALAASMRANGESSATTANSLGWLGLALVYQGQAKEGETVSRRAVALQHRLHPSGSAEVGVADYSLGLNLIANGKTKEAIATLEEAADLIGKFLGKNNGYYMATLTGLARAKHVAGDLNGAEQLYRRALAIGATVESRYRIFAAQAAGYLGTLLTDKKEYDEGERLLKESERIYRELLGEGNSNGAAIEASLGRLYFAKGDLPAAAAAYQRAFVLIPKFFPPEQSVSLNANAFYGLTLTRLGRAAEGEPYLRRALETRRKILPAGNFLIALSESALGECLMAQRRDEEAALLLRSGYDTLQKQFGNDDARVIEARARLEKLRVSNTPGR
ncbi:MAG: tetratricopeptide repeat protein, partial [Verrucomicrobiota bacterium]|nr:tetratricopeptide repeat protein [Verrucomicrobiota bacterium]